MSHTPTAQGTQHPVQYGLAAAGPGAQPLQHPACWQPLTHPGDTTHTPPGMRPYPATDRCTPALPRCTQPLPALLAGLAASCWYLLLEVFNLAASGCTAGYTGLSFKDEPACSISGALLCLPPHFKNVSARHVRRCSQAAAAAAGCAGSLEPACSAALPTHSAAAACYCFWEPRHRPWVEAAANTTPLVAVWAAGYTTWQHTLQPHNRPPPTPQLPQLLGAGKHTLCCRVLGCRFRDRPLNPKTLAACGVHTRGYNWNTQMASSPIGTPYPEPPRHTRPLKGQGLVNPEALNTPGHKQQHKSGSILGTHCVTHLYNKVQHPPGPATATTPWQHKRALVVHPHLP